MGTNPKIKILNPKQYPDHKFQSSKLWLFCLLFFLWGIWICFGFSASNFEFNRAIASIVSSILFLDNAKVKSGVL